MVDFGPTSVTKGVAPSEFSYNTPLFLSQMKEEGLEKSTVTEGQAKTREFKDSADSNRSSSELIFKKNTSGEKTLDESKDSDEGFSSSFSPTSESQMLQQETSGVNSAFWGTQRDDFLHHEFQMGASTPLMYSSPSGNSQLPSGSSFRRGVAPGTAPGSFHTGNIGRRPFPAVSTLLASNKAVANALGVSNWNTSPNPSSSWPNHSPNSAISSTWPQQSRPQLPFPLSISSQSPVMSQSRSTKFSPFPVANFPQKPYKNNRPVPSFTPNSSQVSKTASPFGLQNSVNNHNGLDMTIVDDITQLTNTFSNLTTASEANTNGLYSSNQVSARKFVSFSSLL